MVSQNQNHWKRRGTNKSKISTLVYLTKGERRGCHLSIKIIIRVSWKEKKSESEILWSLCPRWEMTSNMSNNLFHIGSFITEFGSHLWFQFLVTLFLFDPILSRWSCAGVMESGGDDRTPILCHTLSHLTHLPFHRVLNPWNMVNC